MRRRHGHRLVVAEVRAAPCALLQDEFHDLCKRLAAESLNELATAIERARPLVACSTAVIQADLRDHAEAAINALASLECTRRLMNDPIFRGEPLQNAEYDRGLELQIGGSR